MSNSLDHINPLKDKTNPKSVINLTPTSVSSALALIPDDVFELTEEELRSAGDTTQYEEMLRIAFWKEYDSAMNSNRKIKLANIYGGVCGQHYFLKKVVSNSFRLAYVLSLPKNYEVEMTDIQQLANQRIREMLTLPLLDAKGNFNGHLGNTIHRIWETSLDRVRGSIITRNESKTFAVNAEVSEERMEEVLNHLSVKDIDEQLAVLEGRKDERVVGEEDQIIELEDN